MLPLVLFTVAIVSGFYPALALEQGPAGSAPRKIVIDPGHGGPDTGARGPEGIYEKEVTLALAEKIKENLDDKYDVQLTRTGDYRLSATERVSIANSHTPDLFITLHTGAGFRQAFNRWAIYHLPQQLLDEPAEEKVLPRVPFQWNRVQQRHINSAIDLAAFLKKRIQETESISFNVEILPAPVKLLQGADMPAVAMETGYITHPRMAGHLADDVYLSRLAEAISRGVRDYLEKRR